MVIKILLPALADAYAIVVVEMVFAYYALLEQAYRWKMSMMHAYAVVKKYCKFALVAVIFRYTDTDIYIWKLSRWGVLDWEKSMFWCDYLQAILDAEDYYFWEIYADNYHFVICAPEDDVNFWMEEPHKAYDSEESEESEVVYYRYEESEESEGRYADGQSNSEDGS